MAKPKTPPLFFHLHEYAAETASVIARLEAMRAFSAGELVGALAARTFEQITDPELIDA